MRIFIAIDTPEEIKRNISALQSELKATGADVKWEISNKFHITLKFLGETNEIIIPELILSIEKIADTFPPFRLKYKNIGSFPNRRNPKIIWVGCENSDGILEKIKNTIDSKLIEFGFETENRKFHPHITLGRVKSPKRIKYLLPIIENITFDTEAIVCREILLMKSDLKPTGSEYTIIKTINLKNQ